MPLITVRNLTSSRVNVSRSYGYVNPFTTRTSELTAGELEDSLDQIISLVKAGLIEWVVEPDTNPYDDVIEPVTAQQLITGNIVPNFASPVGIGSSNVVSGTGDPEGSRAAPVGSVFLRTDGTSGATFYVKETGGAGPSGWVVPSAGSLSASGFPVDITKSTALEGVSSTAAKSDHKHDVSTASAAEITDSTNSEGVATSLARSDHGHAHGNRGGGALHTAVIPAGNSGFMTGADKFKLDGVATGATNTPITSSSPGDVTKATAAVGISTEAARADHKHDVSTASAGEITDATSSEGSSTSLARSDHGHAHGNRGGGSLHANVVPAGASGFMTGADKTKLDGVAAGSTNTPLTSSTPENVTKDNAVVGVSTTAARSDHKHNVSTASAGEITDATNSEGSATSLARSDHGHAHGNRGGGSLHANVVPAGNAGFMTGADKTKLDGVEALADVTDWTNVRNSLGGEAGANTSWTFKSDGAGGGAMSPNKLTIVRKFMVGLAGSDVDYNSVKEAVDAAITAGVSTVNSYFIEIAPGTYTEDPFTLPPGLFLSSGDGERGRLVTLVAANPLVDFITVTGGALYGFEIKGVTDPAAACIRYAAPFTSTSFANLTLGTCSNGIIVENGATAAIDNVLVAVLAPAAKITNAFIFRGANTVVLGRALMGNVPSAVLPAYPGVNPVETFITVDDQARVQLSNISTNIAHNTASQTSVIANGSCELLLQSSLFTGSATAITIGATGATQLKLLSVDFSLNTLNLESLSASATIQANISVDAQKRSLAAGTQFSGVVLNQATDTTNTYGLSSVYTAPGAFPILQVADHLYKTGSSAIYSGGELTDGGGLNIDIAAGSGTVRDTADSFIRNVTWSADSILLSASTSYFLSYQASTDTIVATVGAPGTSDILLGIVTTNGSAIRYIHTTGNVSSDHTATLHDYLYDTRRVVLRAGLTPQIGSGATKISVDAGTYYLTTNVITYAGAVDATFNAFYGLDGASELTAQTDINTTQWDSAGTLTAFTAGYFRTDTLYLTSEGRLSLIFGSAEFSTQLAADAANPVAPLSFISASAIALATLVVEEGVGIVTVVDRRPTGRGTGGAAGAAVTDHGALAGLMDDDHTQYLLGSGSRAMSGTLDMGNNNITNVNLVDGINVTAHASRHAPGALDALSTGTAAAALVGDTNAEGSSALFARSDHKHAVSRAAPSTIGATNVAGTASTFVGSDHVHAHGAQTDGTMHAAAIPAGASGFLTGSDKTKLDNSGVLTSTAPAAVTKDTAAVGVSVETARADHKHDITTAAAGTIAVGDSAAEGAATSLSRSDHTHALAAPAAPANVTRAAASAGAATTVARSDHKHDVNTSAPSTIGTANAEGTSSSLARADHVHNHGAQTDGTLHAAAIPAGASGFMTGADKTKLDGLPADAPAITNSAPVNVTKAAAAVGVAADAARADHKHDITTATAGTIAVGDSAAEGAATSLARSDHTHALTAPTAPADVTKAAASAGVATTVARSDHKHDVTTATAGTIAVGDAAAEGAATSLARSDHTHALTAPAAPVAVTKEAASAGVATTVARSDHKHDVSTATAGEITDATNSEGTSTSLARADHGHAHGNRGGGTLHAAAVPAGNSGFMTGADKLKLDGVATGATNTPLTASAPAAVTKAAAAVGVSTDAARSDHKHDVTTATAGTITVGAAAAEGTATTLARSDHAHALTAPAAPADVTKAAASAGVATTVARSDHKHDVTTAAAGTISVGAAAAEGAATSLARSDHTHALTAPAAPANVTKAAASAGVATTVARSDHKHDVSTGVPVSIGVANAEGTATTLARSDHVHAGGGGGGTGSVIQTVFNEITVDTSTTSLTFVSLMSQAITITANSRLLIRFDASYSAVTNNTDTSFRISVDGTPRRGTGGTARNTTPASDSSSITWVSGPLAAGSRTVLIEWLVSSSTANINVVTVPSSHHASLVIQEISA